MTSTIDAAPAWPTTLTEHGGIARLAQLEMVLDRLDRLRKAYNRHQRWLVSCSIMLAGGPETNPRTMPGKAAKYAMYGEATALINACGWRLDERTRCHSMTHLGQLMTHVEGVLRDGPWGYAAS